MQKGRLRNDIIGRPHMHGTEGHNSSLDRIDIAADNGLNLGDKIASSDQGILGFMGKGGVPALTFKSNFHLTCPCKERPPIGRDFAYL